MTPTALRTPEECLSGLPGFGPELATPRYLEDLLGLAPLRLAYLDEGPGDAPVALCLHGEPTWSFLYRTMIPVFRAAGLRVVAPDFFGFGRSDKPTDPDRYTFDFHREAVVALITRLELRRITLVCQDWGGLIGLTLPVDMADRIERLIVMNTALAVGESPGEGFLAWRDFMAKTPELDVAALMKRAVPGIDEAAAAAYAAPFPDGRYLVGVRRFPAIVPITPDMPGAAISRRAAGFWASEWSGPTFMAVGARDPVLGPPVMQRLKSMIRGCPEPLVLPEVGHFVQEAAGEEVARAALRAFGDL